MILVCCDELCIDIDMIQLSQWAPDVKWRRINVDATLLRRIDDDTTSFWY